MKKLIICLLIIVFGKLALISQPCPTSTVFFTTQTQIDSFPTKYPNCSETEWGIYISGENINNLDSLSNIKKIGGVLNIYNNPVLDSIEGLQNLTEVGSNLEIINNTILSSLNQLANLNSIGNHVFIEDNHVLTNLSGFENIDSINGTLRIKDCDLITDLSGLDNLVYIRDHFSVKGCENLKDLEGIEKLEYIGQDIAICCNPVLTSISTLKNVISDGPHLSIAYNNSLTSLVGLDNLGAESMNYLVIVHNSNLKTCEVETVCNYLIGQRGYVEIHDNLTGCNSEDEVNQACLVNLEPKKYIKSKVKIYPNPTSSMLNITSENMRFIRINIFNSFGQKVLSVYQPNDCLDVSSLTPGYYLVVLYSNESNIIQKLLIE